MQAAAGSGSLEVVQFLHHLGGDGVLTYWVMAAAAESGSLDVAAYLLKAGCPMQAQAWFRVGQVGNVAMARWLVKAGHLPVTHQYEVLHVWPADRTAEHSRQLLEVVRLVAPPGGSAGEHTMRDASRPSAERGDLDLMRYLHEELGAELWDGALPDAAYGGCEAAIEWLVERGCGAGEAEQLDRCYVRAAASGNLSALERLRRLGVPWSEGLLVQAVLDREVRLPAVQWMWGQGARSGRQELERALAKRRGRKRGDVKEPVVEWLRGQLARPKGSAARARCG